jgi:16S rRNA (guanine527-N7)-methyltransferase
MGPDRIAELLQPFLSDASGAGASSSSGETHLLSRVQLDSISTYIDILLYWNARINLTAVSDPEEIVTRHFGESLFCARHLFPRRADGISTTSQTKGPEHLADLGSGAGFPGIAIKLWAPHIALTLIESNQKKATFLREVTRALTLTDINIQNARAEALPLACFDIVTLRAVERFDSVLPTAGALLAPRGRLALLISASQLKTLQARLPAFRWDSPIPVPASQSRLLAISAPKI